MSPNVTAAIEPPTTTTTSPVILDSINLELENNKPTNELLQLHLGEESIALSFTEYIAAWCAEGRDIDYICVKKRIMS